MKTLLSLSSAQLKKAAAIKDRINKLEKQLSDLLGAPAAAAATTKVKAPKKRKFSAAGLARIRAAQKLRWAKVHAAKKG